jgi:PAS domain S-box-containing protein
MKRKHLFIILVALLGLVVWALDALADSLFLEKPLMDALFLDVSGFELFHRLALWLSFSVLVILLLGLKERRDKARTALRESEEMYRISVENANDGVAIFQDLTLRFVNPSLARMLRYTVEEMVGTRATDYVPESELPRLLEMYEKRMGGGDAPRLYETVLVAKNGDPVPVEVNIEVINYGGRPADMAFYRDISLRKRTEGELRESEKRYRFLVENTYDLFYRVNLGDESYAYLSPALEKILGYTPDEFIEMAKTGELAKRIHPDDMEMLLADAEKLRDNGRGALEEPVIEYRLLHKDGGYRWLSDARKVVFDEKGKAIAIVGVSRDISERKLAEEELRKSEERFKAVFDHSLIGLYRTTPDGKILMANPALLKMLDYASFEELARRNLEENGYEPRYPRSEFKERIELDGAVVGLESVWLKRDGTPVHIRESARAVRDADGRTLYYEGTVEDITGIKKAEVELKKRDLSYRSLVNNAGVGIATTDARGRFTMINERLSEMFGYSEEELLGTHFGDYLHPEDKKQILKIFLNAWKQPYKRPRIEFRGIRKDGSLVHCFSCPTLTLFGGEIIRFNAIIVDITEMKRAEAALRASEERYRTFTEEAQIGIYIYDHGRLLFVNPAMERITGYSREELLAMDTGRMEVPDELKNDEIREEVRQQEDENVHHYNMHLLRKDGGIAILEFQTHPIVFEGRNVTFGNCMDITEMKKNEERLREVIAEKEVLLREIHHRVKNNLQIISSLLYLGSEDLTESDAIAAFRESQNRIKIMAHIHEMLYQSQDTGSIFLPVYLADITSSIFSSYSTDLGDLDYELDIDDFSLGIDTAIPLGLCVNELVANSIEHGFPDGKGRISISFKKGNDGHFSLCIADSGVGLPEGIEIGRTRSLGLQLVKMMVEQLQGELEVHRKDPTAFTITFSQGDQPARGSHIHG